MIVYRDHLVPTSQTPVLGGSKAWVEGANDNGTVLGRCQGVQADTLASAHTAIDLHHVRTRCGFPVDDLVRRKNVLHVHAQDGDRLSISVSLLWVIRGSAEVREELYTSADVVLVQGHCSSKSCLRRNRQERGREKKMRSGC